MSRCRLFLVALCLVVLPERAFTQDPSTVSRLCRVSPCGLQIDWGMGGTPGCARMGSANQIRNCAQTGQFVLGGAPDWTDPRYGAAAEFPVRVRQYLSDAGYVFTDDFSQVKLRIFIKPEVVNAMCDVVAGTGSTESCRTIGRAQVEFQGEDPSGQTPKDFRITNRCGNGERMQVARFGQYTAEMLDRALRPGGDRPRPSLRCRL